MKLDELKRLEPIFLPKAKRTGYICPQCGNGQGADGDGLVLDKHDRTGTHYKCFKCGLYGTVIDLVGIVYGLTENTEMIKKAYEVYGVERETENKNRQKQTVSRGDKVPQQNQDIQENQQKQDYTNFFLKAQSQNDYKYLLGRGLSENTQKYFQVGFVPDWVSPQAIKTTIEKGGNPANLPTSPRCIIPRDRFNYLARDTRQDLTQDQKRFEKQNCGRTSLFNTGALNERVVFIVEGEIDSMSIYQAGGSACGLCSVSNRKLLLDWLKDHRQTGQAFILMLDNDEAGKAGAEELKKGLSELGLVSVMAEYPEGVKDPNDYLQKDPDGLTECISFLKAEALEALRAERGNEYNAFDLLDYFKTIEAQPAGFEAPTGFVELDKELDGGLHEGLYIIGAISSLGKTTFSLQLADQLAGNGFDVIFFSLEMSKYELIAKSLSRHTYDIARDARTPSGHFLARDIMQVLNKRKYKYYSTEEKRVISEAITNYEAQARNLYIYEGRYKGQRLTVNAMRDIVQSHINQTGRKPVVFVDYLQIIAPADVHATDKQNTDINTFELKEISRDYGIPVFAISSFNRENYLEPVSMTSFKESGAVEYSSDVLFGLQYAGMEYIEGDTDKKRRERLRELTGGIYQKKRNREPIEIELKCLKNRTGYQFTISFLMIPAYNHFETFLTSNGFHDFMSEKEQERTKRKTE